MMDIIAFLAVAPNPSLVSKLKKGQI